MSFKKNIPSLSILGATICALSSCNICEYKDSITLYPHDASVDIRFPLNKGEASVGMTLSYSLSEQTDCEFQSKFGKNYANELIVGHACQAVGEQLQHKRFSDLLKSQEWQEKQITKHLKNYFSCFDIDIFSVKLTQLRREPNCVLKSSPILAPGCYDYTIACREKE